MKLPTLVISLRRDDRGIALVLWSLVLPALLAVAVLTVEGGAQYQRHAELQHLAKQAGNSALLAFSHILVARAENEYRRVCSGDEPPSKCSEPRLLDFVSAENVAAIAEETSVQERLRANAEDFIARFDPAATVQADDFTLEFPLNLAGQANTVSARVTISETIERFFTTDETQMTVTALATLPLQP